MEKKSFDALQQEWETVKETVPVGERAPALLKYLEREGWTHLDWMTELTRRLVAEATSGRLP
jgi:hypothetical protein